MKIAVVGCGAVGSFYGAQLCRAGHETHFLLRSDYPHVREHGVQILSCEGDFQVRPLCADNPRAIGSVDLVLIGLKTTANQLFAQLLPPLVGAETLVVTLQNGLGNEEPLAALLGPEHVLCGLCFVCLNRTSPGVIRHLAHGQVVLGEFRGSPHPRTEALAALFKHAQIRCEVTPDLVQAHWEKLVWNIPFNGLGVAGAAGYSAVLEGHVPAGASLSPCLPTNALLGDPRWQQLVWELMFETIAIGRALGLTLSDDLARLNVERTHIMGGYQASTLLDYARGFPLELEAMFVAPLRCAQRAGVSVPRLAALCAVLEQLEARNHPLNAL